jgi:hypothetical protein
MSESLLSAGLLLLHAAATTYMTGLVWFAQVVRYPLFALVREREFPTYADAHSRRTNLVVGAPMLIEPATTAALVWQTPAPIPKPSCWIGLFLLALIWVSMVALQVPRHTCLAKGFD